MHIWNQLSATDIMSWFVTQELSAHVFLNIYFFQGHDFMENICTHGNQNTDMNKSFWIQNKLVVVITPT